MRLVTFELPGPLGPMERVGAWREGGLYVDLNAAAAKLYAREGRPRPQARADFLVPSEMLAFLDGGDETLAEATRALEHAPRETVWSETQVRLLAPLPRPRSLRDFFAFEDHAKAGAARRKEPMPQEWYQQPLFYKGVTRGILGPGDTIPWPSYTRKLDFEFEIAAVVGRECRDVPASEAGARIAGYMVMNDCSARDIQKNEMLCRLGPAKAKDFATVLGPHLVTADEWKGHLPEMTVRVNGQEWSRSKGVQPYWTFAVMLSHASQGETLLPGDVLGSGTYHTGCGIDMDRWLKPGDALELDAGPLGVLRNAIGAPAGQTHLRYDRDGSLAR